MPTSRPLVPNPLLNLAAAASRYLPASLKRAIYKLGPASRGLRAALNKAAPQGLSEVVVASGGLAGTRLMLDLQSQKDYWLGTYEMELQQAIADRVKTGMVVYDLGANIGYVSLLLARAVGPTGIVFAFEALPANQERLAENLKLNSNKNIKLISKAVADKSGSTPFLVHSSGGMGKLSESDSDHTDTINVEAVSLDEFAFLGSNSPPQLIKMDIEGGEVLALRGMRRLLKEARPVLLIELHGKQAAEAAWQTLRDANYSLHFMRKGYPRIESPQDLSKKSYVVASPNAS
jgi:FkbM family methyltransferase